MSNATITPYEEGAEAARQAVIEALRTYMSDECQRDDTKRLPAYSRLFDAMQTLDFKEWEARQ